SLVVKVDSGRTTDLSNTASASTTTTGTDEHTTKLTERFEVESHPDIDNTKSDSPDPVLAGNNLTYTLGVHNGGPSDALGVVLSDPIPAGTSFFSATGGGTYIGITNPLTWNLSPFPSTTLFRSSLVVKVDSGRTTDLSNTASASTTTT